MEVRKQELCVKGSTQIYVLDFTESLKTVAKVVVFGRNKGKLSGDYFQKATLEYSPIE